MWFLTLYIFARLFWRARKTLVQHPPGSQQGTWMFPKTFQPAAQQKICYYVFGFHEINSVWDGLIFLILSGWQKCVTHFSKMAMLIWMERMPSQAAQPCCLTMCQKLRTLMTCNRSTSVYAETSRCLCWLWLSGVTTCLPPSTYCSMEVFCSICQTATIVLRSCMQSEG